MSKLLLALALAIALAFVAVEARSDRLFWNRNTNGNQQIRSIDVPSLSNNKPIISDDAGGDTSIDQDSLLIYGSRIYHIRQKNGANNDQVIGTNLGGTSGENHGPGEDFTGAARGPNGFYYAYNDNGPRIMHDGDFIANVTWDGYGAVNGDGLYFMNGNQVRRLDLKSGNLTDVLNGVVQFTILDDDFYYATGNSIMVIRNFRDDPVPAADTILSGNATETNNIQGFVAAKTGAYWCNNNADIHFVKLDGSDFKVLIEGNNNNCAGSMQYSAAVPQAAAALAALVLAAVAALLF